MSNKKSDFWYYTRNERKATLFLMILVLILFLIPSISQFMANKLMPPEKQAFQEVILELTFENKDTSQAKQPAKLFHFDPNTADKSALQALNLPQNTVNTILNYRKKGGRFRTASDLANIYTLNNEDFQRLLPYIKIAESKTAKTQKSQTSLIVNPLFKFDPNVIKEEDLQRLGLSKKVVRNWTRYREKGGQFRKAADVKKIYGLAEKEFKRLLPYIDIKPTKNENQASFITKDTAGSPEIISAKRQTIQPVQIDVNQASIKDWQQLHGIGPSYSKRIVNFRDKLGGFHHIEQVAETYGLPDSTFQKIRSQLLISPVFKFIHLNSVDAETLKEHPYIQWKQANIIIAYRTEHGPFKQIDDLSKVRALPTAFIEKIAPYLHFDWPHDQ